MNSWCSDVFGIYSWEIITIMALNHTPIYNFVIHIKNYQLPQYIYHFEGIEFQIKTYLQYYFIKKN